MARIFSASIRNQTEPASRAWNAGKRQPEPPMTKDLNQQFNERSNLAPHILVITGIAVLLWSGLEDHDAVVVTVLGTLLATAAAVQLLDSRRFRVRARQRSLRQRLALAGALAGTLASITTPLLMLFKDLRHAHVFPDYPPEMMLATLERMPSWALAGGLAGFGIGILLKLRQDRH